MSGTDETLSLESLFAFVDGLSPRAGEPGASRADDGAKPAAEPCEGEGREKPRGESLGPSRTPAPEGSFGEEGPGASDEQEEPGAPDGLGVPEALGGQDGFETPEGPDGPAPREGAEPPEGPAAEPPEGPAAEPPAEPDGAEGPAARRSPLPDPAAAALGEPEGLALLSMVVQLPAGLGAPAAMPEAQEEAAPVPQRARQAVEEAPPSPEKTASGALRDGGAGPSAGSGTRARRDAAGAPSPKSPADGRDPAAGASSGTVEEPRFALAGRSDGNEPVGGDPCERVRVGRTSVDAPADVLEAEAEPALETPREAGKAAGEGPSRRKEPHASRPRHAARGKHAAASAGIEPAASAGQGSPAPCREAPGAPLVATPSSITAPLPPLAAPGPFAPEPASGELPRHDGPTGPLSMEEARAAIEARLVRLVSERTEQISGHEPSAPGGRPSAASAPAPEQAEAPAPDAARRQPKGLCALRRLLDRDARPAARAGVPALETPRPAASGPEPQPGTRSEPQPELQPEPEPEAIAAGSSIMFDEPAPSIVEGMRLAETEYRRGFALKVAAGAAAAALGIAAVAFLASHLAFLSGVPEGADVGGPTGETQQAMSGEGHDRSGEDAGRGEAPGPSAPERDLSGTVVYRYKAADPDGGARPTVETVAFGADGLCETSTIEVELADAEAAEAFLEGMERDFGSAYREGSADGATVRATVDVSANKLDREAYEDELRVSVEDLSIVKKS